MQKDWLMAGTDVHIFCCKLQPAESFMLGSAPKHACAQQFTTTGWDSSSRLTSKLQLLSHKPLKALENNALENNALENNAHQR